MSPAYPLIMLAAIVSGAVVSRFTQSELRIAKRDKLLIGLAAFSGSMIAAKLPFVFTDISRVLNGGALLGSGKTIMCGLVGGYFGVELAKWYLGVKTKTGDSYAVPVAVAIGIGRLACFAGGCCFGTPTNSSWGVVFPHVDQLRRHPTQLYEATFHLMMAIVLWMLWTRRAFRCQLIKLYFLAYFAYRFCTEFIRPEARLFGQLTGYQWAAIVWTPLFAWLWWRDARVMSTSSLTTN